MPQWMEPDRKSAAWTLVPRDNCIGWSPEKRKKNLPLVIDNPRFPILLWTKIPNLRSHIRTLVRRRLPQDWTERYKHHPGAHRNRRRNPALHWRRLPGFGRE
ncbi:MAG: DUF4338 domain-containing protein [Gammaproteobacteria bacterium]|nr:DUF4338 domain-containing protein [Gammaproteobacteria bacterium]